MSQNEERIHREARELTHNLLALQAWTRQAKQLLEAAYSNDAMYRPDLHRFIEACPAEDMRYTSVTELATDMQVH